MDKTTWGELPGRTKPGHHESRGTMSNPTGMNRRHFMKHAAGYSLMALPALQFMRTIQANAQQMRRNNKSLIIMWMGGGPATIDIWDLKPGRPTGGEFRPVDTAVSG